jgi:hypothetical protein
MTFRDRKYLVCKVVQRTSKTSKLIVDYSFLELVQHLQGTNYPWNNQQDEANLKKCQHG